MRIKETFAFVKELFFTGLIMFSLWKNNFDGLSIDYD